MGKTVEGQLPTVFRRAALISGLISQQQLDEALRVASQSAGDEAATEPIDDETLGNTLVRLDYLNPWQVQQLKAGRTKFTLGPYQIVDSIGRGGMGHVFKGQHSMLGRIEAVKVLPKHQTTPEAVRSFQREIRAQAQLDHPNLVRISYADQDGDTYFFVTEYVPGTDLRRLVRSEGPLSMERAATIVSQAAEALQYVHERGIVHRDIKPGNLLVTLDGRTKLSDLGLAGFFHGDEAEDDNRAAKIVGTADYLAPEAIRSPGDILPASDVYALGCTLYYAVTGKVPFPGGKTSDKMRRHCNEAPIHPKRFNPDLSDEFLEVIGDMMEKDLRRRIATAAEVVRRLQPWVESEAGSSIGPRSAKSYKVSGAATTAQGTASPGSATPSVGSRQRSATPDAGPAYQTPSDSTSFSQISQITDSVMSDEEETIPIKLPSPSERLRPRRSPSARIAFLAAAVLIMIGLAAVLAALFL